MTTPSRNSEAMQQAGYENISTGGGYFAWYKPFPSGRHVWVTRNELKHDPNEDLCVVCAYDHNHQQLGEPWEGPLSQAANAMSQAESTALEDGLKAFDKTACLDAAIDAAAKAIQDALGVKTGDEAGIFFTGENDEAIKAVLGRYIDFQIAFLKAYQLRAEAEVCTETPSRQTPRS